MKILLDTHLLLWAAAGKLAPNAAAYIENMSNTLLFSSAGIWEIIIKCDPGRPDFAVDPAALYGGLLGAGYVELPVTARHSLLLRTLPMLHKDPFDRIMIAQAASEGITFITADKVVAQYPGSIVYVG